MAQQNGRFEVVGVAVRDKAKPRDVQIPDELLVDDPELARLHLEPLAAGAPAPVDQLARDKLERLPVE